MRIAFIAQPFDQLSPPVQGGSLAIWIYQTARICVQRGNATFAFANTGGLFRRRSTSYEGVEYIYTPTGPNRVLNKLVRLGRRAGLRQSKLPDFASGMEDLGYAIAVARHARRIKCDVVHVMNFTQYVPVIRRWYPECKIALEMQCEWLTQLDPAVMASRMEQTDLIIGCSEYITQKTASRFPQFASRCVTVPNAASVPRENDRSAEEPGSVLFVGRVSPEKGVHDLIRAFHEVLKRFPGARLHITGGIGSAPLEWLVGLSNEPHVVALRVFYQQRGDENKGSYLKFLEAEAGQELGKRIIFEGRIDHAKTETFYHRAAVLVNPSLSESFGMTLVEAMMHRVPVVATKVGGMPYIVDPERTGLLVDPASPPALAAAICEILGDRERSRRMGDAGRLRAIERFSWEKSTDTMLDHFESIVN